MISLLMKFVTFYKKNSVWCDALQEPPAVEWSF